MYCGFKCIKCNLRTVFCKWYFYYLCICILQFTQNSPPPEVYLCQKHALVISVVPADRQRMQTDEAVRVLRQLQGVPIQSHLVHVGPDVVTGVAFAERLICYS